MSMTYVDAPKIIANRQF